MIAGTVIRQNGIYRRLAIGITGLWAVLFLAGCGGSTFLSQPAQEESDVTMSIKGLEAWVTNEGKPEYTLTSTQAMLLEKRNCIQMDTIHIKFFRESGDEESGNLTSDHGYYYFREAEGMIRNRGDVDLIGRVLVNMPDGAMLRTEEIVYDGVTRKISSGKPFEKSRVSEKQVIKISGKGFVTDRDMLNWEVTGAVMSVDTPSTSTQKAKES